MDDMVDAMRQEMAHRMARLTVGKLCILAVVHHRF